MTPIEKQTNLWRCLADMWLFFIYSLAGAEVIHIVTLVYNAYFLTV